MPSPRLSGTADVNVSDESAVSEMEGVCGGTLPTSGRRILERPATGPDWLALGWSAAESESEVSSKSDVLWVCADKDRVAGSTGL